MFLKSLKVNGMKHSIFLSKMHIYLNICFKNRKPLPLNTIALQKLASKKLKMASSKVMEVAENLYRSGFISYPRTETDIFDKGTNLKSLVDIQRENPEWGNYASK